MTPATQAALEIIQVACQDEDRAMYHDRARRAYGVVAQALADLERERGEISAAYLATPNVQAELLQVVIERDDWQERAEQAEAKVADLEAQVEARTATWQ